MQANEDSELLAQARAGDDKALQALIERHQSQVYRFGMKMCRDPEDAKDVLQDTMLAVARGVRDFRGASSISTWLYTIARSYCIKKRRKSPPAEETETSAAGQVADATQSPEERLAGKEVEQALEQAMAALDSAQREVLVLRDVEGLSAAEVAEVLGVSVQAVKSRLHRARLAVRAKVAPLLAIPDSEPPAASCPDVLRLLSRHLEGEISKLDCSVMEQHLAQCSRCRGRCDSLKQTLALCQTAGHATSVPAAVQASLKRALRDVLGHRELA